NAQISVLGQTLSGNVSFESVDGVIAVAASNVTLALPGVSLSNGSGALLLAPAGVAGKVSGTLAVTIPGVSFTGSFSVGVNTTAAPVDRAFDVGGDEVMLNVPAGPFLRVEGTAVTLNILGQQIGGDFAVERNGTTTTIAARNIHFSLGAGSSGVTLTDGEGAFVVTTAGLAGQISGRVALNLPAGISVSGDFSLAVNNTSAAVDQTFSVGDESVHLSLPGGPYLRISAANVQADLLGLRVTGDFSFERALSLGANRVPGGMGADADTPIIRIGIANLAFSLGGSSPIVSVTGGTGAFFVTSAGIAGDLQATVALNVPQVAFSGALRVQFNTIQGAADFDETFQVGGSPIRVQLPHGPYFRIQGTNVDLNVVGQTLHGDFSLTRSTGIGGAPVVSVELSHVTLKLGGTAASPILSLTNGHASLVLAGTGVSGTVSGDIALNVPGVSVSAGLSLAIDTAAGRVRLEGNVNLTTLGLDLSGTFVFEQATNAQGQKVVRVGVSNGSLTLASGVLSLSQVNGLFILTPAGVAASLSAQISLGVSGIEIGGTFALQLNNTNAAVSESVQVGGATLALSLPAGPYVRVAGTGVTIRVAGQRLSGDFSFERVAVTGGNAVRITASNVSLAFGDGSRNFLVVSEGQGAFVILPTGIAGKLSAHVELQNVPGVTLAGTFELALNTTPSPVLETFTGGAFPITLDLPAGSFLRVAGSGVTLRVAGVSLSGNFTFERSILAGQTVVSVSFSNVELGLGDGTTDFLRATDGAGTFVLGTFGLGTAGIYGTFRANVAVDVPGVSFNGRLSVEIDTTSIVQTPDDIPSGLRILGAATLVIAGQEIGGNFLIQRNPAGVVTIAVTDLNFTLTVGGTPLVEVRHLDGVIIVGPQGVSASFATLTFPTFALPGIHIGGDSASTTTTADVDDSATTLAVTSADGFPTTAPFKIRVDDEIMLVTGGEGTMSWTVTRGVDGTDAAAHTSGAAVAIVSEFALQINTGSAAVSESIDVNGDTVDIDVPAGPFVRVIASRVQLCFTSAASCGPGDAAIKGSFFFDQVTRNGFGASIPLPATASTTPTGIATGDVDNDGDTDLAVATGGGSILYLNNGRGVFVPAGVSLFDGGTADATAVKLADVNNDTFLDLIVVNGNGTTKVFLNLGTAATGASGLTPIVDWSLPARFGLDLNNDGLLDYFTTVAMISPGQWPVHLVGCGSRAGSSPIVGYAWTFDGSAAGSTCAVDVNSLTLGTHTVTLTVTAQNGSTATTTQDIELRDLLIVSLGDSVASGEGNPDIPWDLSPFQQGGLFATPKWELSQCHRSALAGPARAALQLEQADPHTSVTFIHLACSGGRIFQIPGEIVPADTRVLPNGNSAAIAAPSTVTVTIHVTAASGTLNAFIQTSDNGTSNWTTAATFAAITTTGDFTQTATNVTAVYYRLFWTQSQNSSFAFSAEGPDGHGGILDPYDGIEPEGHTPLKSQLDQLHDLIGSRVPDAVLISTGANDIKFSDVIKHCIIGNCTDSGDFPTAAQCVTPSTLTPLQKLFCQLPAKYAALGPAFDALNIPRDHVYLTTYFDQTQNGAGVFTDILGFGPLPGLISSAELRWAENNVVIPLNNAVRAAAAANGFNVVNGIAEEFFAHGYAANDHWVVNISESLANQHGIDGSFHPNGPGQDVYARHIFATLAPVLDVNGGAPGWLGFSDTPTTLTTPDATSIAVGDVSGDGFADIVVGADGPAQAGTDGTFFSTFSSASATFVSADAGHVITIGGTDYNILAFVSAHELTLDAAVPTATGPLTWSTDNGKSGTDGAITATSAIFAAASGNFAAGDAGRTITVGGTDYTIDAVVDATTLTLDSAVAFAGSPLAWTIAAAATQLFLNEGNDETTGDWDGFGDAIEIATDPTNAVALGDVDGDDSLDIYLANDGADAL
ncbi:MAG: FG-GAP-like repeat-containing protein, partial [Gaiellaceae bacterium]